MKKNKMLYRIVAAVLACAVVALALVTYQSRSSSNAPVAEGAVTATGSAKGMEGDVVVEVTADATTIYSITVKEQNETQGIGSVVCEQLPDTMVAANSYNVDGIAGATVTSDTLKEAVKAALTEKTKVVYLETPCNPTLKVVDIAEVAKIAHEYNKNIRVIVDNTFCSPYIQQPLSLGADAVVHSATKYINGHGDVIAGFVISDAEFIGKCRMFGLKDMTGAVMSPFNAFLIARGLKTLDIRMERHSANAMKVAEFLHDHPAIDKVYYPGLEDFEGHEIAKKQMKLYGGMMSIELKADRDAVANALNKLQLCTIAVSLGDAETLVEHAASMTHSTYTPEELKASGISEGLVRISVGLEDPDDIIADLKAVLDTLV